MIRCPACGLELPDHARYCARCGARQPGAGTPPMQVQAWLLALFALGAALSAVIGLAYSLWVAFPQLTGPAPATQPQVDPDALRRLATGMAVAGWVLSALNTVALVGLARGRAWGRWIATAACVGWLLTCIGIPVSILVLVNLWRPRAPTGAGTASRTG